MEVWQAIILGIVQGATEWLPVSSSGHLVLSQAVLDVEAPLAFDLLLHMATLLVVVVAYAARLWGLARSLLPEGDPDDRRMVAHLVVATIPIVVVGLLGKNAIEAAFDSTAWVAVGLLVTAVLLASTWRASPGQGLTWLRALVVGAFQALAVWPGVSRSGATIAGGLHAGLDRKRATDFAFMLAIPALVGAAVFQAPALADLGELGVPVLAAGFVAAALAGWVSLQGMRRLVARVGLLPFVPYVLVVAVAAFFL